MTDGGQAFARKIYWIIAGGERGSSPPLAAEEAFHPQEYEKWLKMPAAKRKDEWLLGRWTAKRLVTTQGMPFEGQDFREVLIGNAPEGAPYVVGDDPAGCVTITHCQGLAAAAYARGQQIGIDLERIEPRAENFIRDFFTDAEIEQALNLEGEDRDEWVTLAWSAKEAVLKAWQKGLRLDSRSVEIHPGSYQPAAEWTELSYAARVEGMAACRLVWQRLGEYMLTLAYELDNDESDVEIRQVGGHGKIFVN